MLRIYQGNRLEALSQALLAHRQALWGDPFAPDLVVVPNPGMGRWLLHGMADTQGIAANVAMPLPATFFWRHVLRAWLPEADSSAFDRDTLAWRILDVLPGLIDSPALAPLRRYLAEDESGLRRFQLAGRIADVFDQYLVFRPEMVLAWEQGTDADNDIDAALRWQPLLWRALASPGTAHRARLLHDLLNAMAQPPAQGALLPDTIHLFGLNALPPVYLEITRRLAVYRDVCIYHLSPCQEYWGDIRSERALAHHDNPQEAFLEVGNPLLASFGHVGQVFLEQLLSLDDSEPVDCFSQPAENGILQQLQADIFALRDGRDAPFPLEKTDWPTLQFHGAHTRFREVQVLHDNLLRCFETFEGLTPRDVLVMAPDMAAYAPFVEAVFSAADGERQIPYSIGDRSIGGENPLGEALRWLLQLPQNRFTASEILALLEVDALRSRLGLDTEAVERIRRWVRETGIRWGVNQQHRNELGLPGDEDLHSWRFGLRRLFVGYATPAEGQDWLYDDAVAPYLDIEGSELLWAGALQNLIDRLDSWRARLAKAHSVDDWRQQLLALLDDFFDAADDDERYLLQTLRQRLDDLVAQAEQAGFSAAVSLPVMRELLESSLDDTTPARGFLDGGVTFSNLLPMRALPFRVICLLGMNDSDFPRRHKAPSFDLMVRHPHRSDRDRRRDDRYLFLETLLSARDCLLISWQSRDVRSDKPRLCAEVVSELMEYLDDCYLPRDDGKTASQWLFVQHPLQPFSARYFAGNDRRLFTYDGSWAQLQTEQQPQSPFVASPLPLCNIPGEITLDDLIRFFTNPAATFLQQSLAMRLPSDSDIIDDNEPFSLDALESWDISDRLVQAMLQTKQDAERVIKRLESEGSLPHGLPGKMREAQLSQQAGALAQKIQPWQEQYPWLDTPQTLDITLADFHLTGTIRRSTDVGLLDYRVGKLRPQERLSLWLRHLALATQRGIVEQSHFITEQETLHLHPIQAGAATKLLGQLLDHYRAGLQTPLQFFPRTAWAYACGDKRWETVWYGGYNRPGECEQPAYQMLFADGNPLDSTFQQLAEPIYGPLIERMEVEG